MESKKGRAWTLLSKNGHEFCPVGLCPTSWGPRLGTNQWRLEVLLPVWWWWSGSLCVQSGQSQHTLWLRVKQRIEKNRIKMCLVVRPIDFVWILNEVMRVSGVFKLNWVGTVFFKGNTHFTVFVFPKSCAGWTKQSFRNLTLWSLLSHLGGA